MIHCGYEHRVDSSGVTLVSCLGYDSPSVLYFLWPPKKSRALLMSEDIASVGPKCLASVSIRGDSNHLAWRFCTLHKPWAFVPSPLSRCLGEKRPDAVGKDGEDGHEIETTDEEYSPLSRPCA